MMQQRGYMRHIPACTLDHIIVYHVSKTHNSTLSFQNLLTCIIHSVSHLGIFRLKMSNFTLLIMSFCPTHLPACFHVHVCFAGLEALLCSSPELHIKWQDTHAFKARVKVTPKQQLSQLEYVYFHLY